MPAAFAVSSHEPWVLVCGGFHLRGGMDRANYALARTLVKQGREVHLVGHDVDEALAAEPGIHATVIPRPGGSVLLGERALNAAGMRIARQVLAKDSRTRVVVNGGNCDWADINWAHCVHHAWPPCDEGAPGWFRLKNRMNKWKARHDERGRIPRARVVIANSQRTRRDLIEHLGIDGDRIRTIYPGSEPDWVPAQPEQRSHARMRFEIPDGALVICFAGALGFERNKGFDVLLNAWRELSAAGHWNAFLLVAGGGRGLDQWKQQVQQSGFGDRIRMLGFVEQMADVFAVSDLLVSPVRYEAFGLNVYEAVCRGVPAMVTAQAGIAELYPEQVSDCLLGITEKELVHALLRWKADPENLRQRFAPFGAKLRAYTMQQMAESMIALTETGSHTEATDTIRA